MYVKEIKCLELSESNEIALQESYLEAEIREICRKKNISWFSVIHKKDCP